MGSSRNAARAPRIILALLGVAITCALLVGCGGSSSDISSKSGEEILAASRAAAQDASSVHIHSTASQGALRFESDQQLTSDGGRARVSALGLDYEVIRIGKAIYLRGNPTFYERLKLGAREHIPTGSWLRASTSAGSVASLVALTDLENEMSRLLTSTGPVTKGPVQSINGQRALTLDEAARLFTGVYYIATSGKSYPIRLLKHGRETGQTTFAAWNQPVALTAPTNAIELVKLRASAH